MGARGESSKSERNGAEVLEGHRRAAKGKEKRWHRTRGEKKVSFGWLRDIA